MQMLSQLSYRPRYLRSNRASALLEGLGTALASSATRTRNLELMSQAPASASNRTPSALQRDILSFAR
jgi:hypothetical protein